METAKTSGAIAAGIAALAITLATPRAHATPPCRWPWDRESTPQKVQLASPHAALLESPAAVPLRLATPLDRTPSEVTCAGTRCEIQHPALDSAVFVFRAPSGAVVAAARGPLPAGTLPAITDSAGPCTQEKLALGAEAHIAPRSEEAEPAGVGLYAVAPGSSLDQGALYVWDQPSSTSPSLVMVSLSDSKEPPPLPDLASVTLSGSGACPAHGGVALVAKATKNDISYRWSVLDETGTNAVGPVHVGARPQLHATESSPGLRLGTNYVLEVEAIDPSGRVSPKARFPVALERTGGPGFLWELFLVVLWLLAKSAPVLGILALGTGAFLLARRLRKRRATPL